MKLRLRKNSLRLRLLQSEIKFLKENGSVSETIRFAAESFLTYRLKISDKAQKISADFQNNQITVEIPSEIAGNWIDTEQIGLQAEQETGEKTLSILIEKDFVCVDRPMDIDNADAFPHPNVKCQRIE